jgi:hypothetical protein
MKRLSLHGGYLLSWDLPGETEENYENIRLTGIESEI